jgi:hypothetical protein
LSPDVVFFFFNPLICSFKLYSCILFDYMFQNFLVELIPRATGDEYWNT